MNEHGDSSMHTTQNPYVSLPNVMHSKGTVSSEISVLVKSKMESSSYGLVRHCIWLGTIPEKKVLLW